MIHFFKKPLSVKWVERVLLYILIVTFFVNIQINYFTICILFVFWLIDKRYKLAIQNLKDSKIFQALCVYFVFVLISLVYSINIAYGIKTIESKSALIALPILLAGIHWDLRLRNNVLMVFVLALLMLTFYSIVSTIVQYAIDFSDMSYFSWILPQTSSFTANYYSLFVVSGIIILIFDFKMIQLRIPKILIIFLILYLTFFLAFLGSRASIVGLIAIVILFALHKISTPNLRERKKGVLIIIITIISGAGLIKSVPYLNSRFNQAVFKFKEEPRLPLLSASFTLFFDNPVFGVGIGDVQDKLVEEYKRNKNEEAYTRKYNSHNDWVQILVGNGLIGLSLFVYFFYQLCKKAWKVKNLYMISFLLFYMMISMTESILHRNKGVIFFAFFYSIFFLIEIPEEESTKHKV